MLMERIKIGRPQFDFARLLMPNATIKLNRSRVMSRVQLAINVPNLGEALAFYSRLFDTEPHKVRPGYANFEIDEPPLKLVLVESDGANKLNHLGVEVSSTAKVNAERRRLAANGLTTIEEDGVVCCHAEQDKVWVTTPDGVRWEVYTITDDMLDEHQGRQARVRARAGCCQTTEAAAAG